MIPKPFQSIEQQIDILKNNRNLKFNNELKAKEILSKMNYYNIINGYKKPFLKKDLNGKILSPEQFLENCTFEELFSLYELDRDLKRKIFEYLLLFERTLKTYIAYNFSENHPKEEFPYLNLNNYSKEKKDQSFVFSIITTLSQKLNSRKKADSINHYMNNHDCLPLWVLINELTLGNVSYMYCALKESLKNKIAKEFSLAYKKNYNSKENINFIVLKDIIKICIFYRNICAHDNIMLLFKMHNKINTSSISKILTLHDEKTNPKNHINFEGENLYDLICTLKLVLEKDIFDKLINDLETIFNNYNNKFTVVKLSDILLLGGFKSNHSLDELKK